MLTDLLTALEAATAEAVAVQDSDSLPASLQWEVSDIEYELREAIRRVRELDDTAESLEVPEGYTVNFS